MLWYIIIILFVVNILIMCFILNFILNIQKIELCCGCRFKMYNFKVPYIIVITSDNVNVKLYASLSVILFVG